MPDLRVHFLTKGKIIVNSADEKKDDPETKFLENFKRLS